jgi:hypothetical protein
LSTKLLDYPPQYLRRRANQTRAMAETTICDATLTMLEKRAAEYDRMAELLESSAGSALDTDRKSQISGDIPLRRKAG